MLILSITIDKAGKGVRKTFCTTRLHVEMVHTTLIFINPFHANFENKVHAVVTKNAKRRRYTFTLSLTLALYGVGGQRHTPADLPAGKRPGTQCTRGWVGSGANLHGCGKCHSHRDSIPGSSSLYRVAIPIAPSRPTMTFRTQKNLWLSGSMETYGFIL